MKRQIAKSHGVCNFGKANFWLVSFLLLRSSLHNCLIIMNEWWTGADSIRCWHVQIGNWRTCELCLLVCLTNFYCGCSTREFFVGMIKEGFGIHSGDTFWDVYQSEVNNIGPRVVSTKLQHSYQDKLGTTTGRGYISTLFCLSFWPADNFSKFFFALLIRWTTCIIDHSGQHRS